MKPHERWQFAINQLSSCKKKTKLNVDLNGLRKFEIDYLEKILDPSFDLSVLTNDDVFVEAILSNQRFCSAAIVTTIDTKTVESIITYVEIIKTKVEEGRMEPGLARNMFYLALERAVELEKDDILEEMLKWSEKAKKDDVVIKNIIENKTENLPALLKACHKGSFNLIKLLVSSGYLLR